MKAIINGKRYDTDKAILIGESGNSNECSRGDFRWWEAGLYKTPRSGTYFLAGRGGAMSRFSQPYGQNGSQGGSGIIPLDPEEAFAWAQQELPMSVVEEHFADRIEDA